ncbi:protein nanos-like [Acyrthosiphon pisum]|uniref:Nanos-type domain-containing protein n=1 Tax=Acyrthosiphon pisum TaxID=7029 RepID=A0A8R2JMF5_ACYPI|nr:protein nanos-like [Acyrthosiphon pisum]
MCPHNKVSRCINQNNQRSLTWNISLTDDQDKVSENFLRMYNEPTTVAEKFGSAILTVPENIRKQADELFKPSEINPNEIFDWVNTKVSWILPSCYQQYLKSIPANQSVGWTQVTVQSSPSDCGRSVSSAEFVQYNATADGRSSSPTSVRWPSRLFYCVNADSNTINKLVEHYCTFCYKNHEPPEVYGGHLVRDDTRTTCPKLRALRCKHCSGTGDNAHTIKYCPFLYSNYS